MSKDYEHQLGNAIDRETDDETRAFRIGFSGSSAKPNPDILVTTPRDCYAIEAKKSVRDRMYIDSDDLAQLVECANSYTSVWIVMKFSNREPVTFRYLDGSVAVDDWDDKSIGEQWAYFVPDAFDPHVTDEGNLRLDKPDTDEWSSATAGEEDHIAVLRDMGIKNEKSSTL